MGEIAAVGIDDDLSAGQAGIAVRTSNHEVTGGIDVNIGNIGNIKAIATQNRCDHALTDVLTQLLHFKVSAVHNGHYYGINANHIASFIILYANLRFAIGTQQIVGMDALGQAIAQCTGQCCRQGHQLGSLGTSAAKHHTLIACATDLVIGAQRDICRLGVNAALNFYAIGIKSIASINIADLADCLASNLGIIHCSLGGNFATNQAKVCGNHGLAGNARSGILRQAGIQNCIGDRIRHLVRMAVGNTFRCK